MSDTATTIPRMTVEEFLVWSEGREGRYELYDGEVVTMQSELVSHALATGAVYRTFFDALAKAGTNCTAIQGGVTVKVDDATSYEPDCTVHCGPLDRRSVFASNPVVVVEVVSRSSRSIDTGVKFAGYFRVPSIIHYLIVYADKRMVIHHRRNGSEIVSQILALRQGSTDLLDLDPPGFSVPVSEFFSELSDGGDT